MVCQEFCLKCLEHHWDRRLGDHVGEAFVDSIRNTTVVSDEQSSCQAAF